MALMIASIRDFCRSILNASTVYGTTDDAERHPDAEIDAAIRAAENDIIMALLSTPGHPDRSKFTVTTSTTAHGALIAGHIGAVGMILIGGKAATMLPAAEIERLRSTQNYLNLVDIGPYYDIAGDPPRLFFVGPSGTADIINYTDSGTMLQSPDQYFGAIADDALFRLFSKEGAETPTAQMYLGARNLAIQIIKGGGTPTQSISQQGQ